MVKTNTQMKMGALLCVGLLAGGCATQDNARARADIAVSNAAIADATAADAMRFAPAELQAARREVDLANQAMVQQDYDAASQLANEAEADAALARAKAGSEKAQLAANAVQETIHTLREELGNRQDQTRR